MADAGRASLRLLCPQVPIAVASGEDDPVIIRATLTAGAVGFLPKSEALEVLQQALRLLLGGGTYMPVQALADLRHGAAPPRPDASGQEAESLSIMPAHHAKRRPLVVANARHSPSYGCALRLDRTPFGALLGHARKTLSL